MEEHGVAQGIWPQCKVNCLQPASASVQQLLARALQEIADGALGNAIFEMGVHATESECWRASWHACLNALSVN